MSKKEKLLKKILGGKSDKSITWDEAVSVLETAGFLNEGGKGSHNNFRHPDGRKVNIPRRNVIKPIYIKQIRLLLEK